MQVSRVSSVQYNQKFGGVLKNNTLKGIVEFVSEKGRYLGNHVQKANGDVSGYRMFSKGHSLSYDTSHGTLFKEPYVVMEYRYPIKRKEQGRRLLVFDLDVFKEHMKELTSLKGIKGYFTRIEQAPKTTRFEPCC